MEHSPEAEDSVEDVEIPGVDEVHFKRLADEEVNNTTTTVTEEEEEALVVDADLAGKITINHNGIAMRQLTSNPTGRCWRRLISIVWLS